MIAKNMGQQAATGEGGVVPLNRGLVRAAAARTVGARTAALR